MAKPYSRLSVTEICVSKQLDIPFVATCVPLIKGALCLSDINKVCSTASVILLEVDVETSDQTNRDVEVKVKLELTFTLQRHGHKPVVCKELVSFERTLNLSFPPGGQICAFARATLGKSEVCVDHKKEPTLVITCPATLCLELTIATVKEICVPVVGPCPFPYFPQCDPTCPPPRHELVSGDSGVSSGSDGDDDLSGWGSRGDSDDD